MKKLLGILIVLSMLLTTAGALAETVFTATFDGAMEPGQAMGWQTINFSRDWDNNKWSEFEQNNMSFEDVEGIAGKAFTANIALPDPTNIWYALGMSFPLETAYEGNFKGIKQFSFKYVSNADYSQLVADEDVNLWLELDIKSVEKNTAGEQFVAKVTEAFPMKDTQGAVETFVVDIPADVQEALNTFEGALYFDWFMVAIEDAGENFIPGKITIGEISFMN